MLGAAKIISAYSSAFTVGIVSILRTGGHATNEGTATSTMTYFSNGNLRTVNTRVGGTTTVDSSWNSLAPNNGGSGADSSLFEIRFTAVSGTFDTGDSYVDNTWKTMGTYTFEETCLVNQSDSASATVSIRLASTQVILDTITMSLSCDGSA